MKARFFCARRTMGAKRLGPARTEFRPKTGQALTMQIYLPIAEMSLNALLLLGLRHGGLPVGHVWRWRRVFDDAL